ncbi:MAG: site-specific integrase [Deltaproteobacteria bacterium]|jgi:integrase|nr:site-specific integrase [Deltaproteobacteria bacterium]MBT6501464.1 site-specific integrase [Deltaproteobacteria bacterium]MBT7713715.1 site-specific integrase [Deltaproteobacteria bacterium]
MIKQFTDKKGQTAYIVQAYGTDRRGNQVRRKRVLHNPSRAAAKKLEKSLIEQLVSIKAGDSFSNMTYSDYLLKEFYPWLDETEPQAYDYVLKSVNKWAKPIMELQMDAINTNDIRMILDNVAKTCSNSTVQRVKGYLNKTFRYACDGGMKNNPCANVSIKKSVGAEFMPEVLTKPEIKILLQAARIHKPDWYHNWCFVLHTGLRSGECHEIRRYDVSLEDKMISVSRSWNSKLGISKCTKTGKFRTIPIADAIMPMVRELMVGDPKGHLLPRNKKWDKGRQSEVLKDFCRSIGITPVKYHSLRATFLTHLLSSGCSIPVCQKISGHSDLKSFMIYIRLAGVDLKGATNALNLDIPGSVSVNKVVNLFK